MLYGIPDIGNYEIYEGGQDYQQADLETFNAGLLRADAQRDFVEAGIDKGLGYYGAASQAQAEGNQDIAEANVDLFDASQNRVDGAQDIAQGLADGGTGFWF